MGLRICATGIRYKLAFGLALVCLLLKASAVWKLPLGALVAWVSQSLGLFGIASLTFVTNTLVSPLPPDAFLLLLAGSPYHQQWYWIVPGLGALASLGGIAGYGIGRLLRRWGIAQGMFERVKPDLVEKLHRHSSWAIALGALTLLPFSVCCWTAGWLKVPFARVAWPCLLRIPRYFVYYAVFTGAFRLASLWLT